jgi:hypothetical protein
MTYQPHQSEDATLKTAPQVCCRGPRCANCPETGETDAASWPDLRNRGLLQAAKQAAAALKKWHMGGSQGEHHGSMLIYEARSYLERAIRREEAWRAAFAPSSATHGVALPVGPRNGLAHIEGDSIVIRLTADACAFAFANDPQAQDPRPPVIDKQQFLRETFNALTAEREDGSTPLTDVLDRSMVKAWEDGAEGLDHDATPGVPACQGEQR